MSIQKQILVEDARRHNFCIIDNEVVDDTSLSVNAKAAYLVLVHHADRGTGVCYLTCDTLGRKMGTGRNGKSRANYTARRAVAELATAGLIEIDKREGQSSVFRVLDVAKKTTPLITSHLPRS